MVLQVVIPMAGLGSRFMDYGFQTNKYLLPIDTSLTPMIELAITSLNISVPARYLFILREQPDTLKVIELLKTIAEKYKLEYKILTIQELTEGPASTVYLAKELLNLDEPLLVSNSDQVLDWNFDHFYDRCQQYEGCVLTYKPEYPLILGEKDKHSFLRIDESDLVCQFAEKIVLSEHALVGVHYYKTAQLFVEAYQQMVQTNLRAPNGEFYLSLTYQVLLEQHKSVGYSEIKGTFYPVGEPMDYFDYLYQRGGYDHKVKILEDREFIVNHDDVKIWIQEYLEKTLIQPNGLILYKQDEIYRITNKAVVFDYPIKIIHIQSPHFKFEQEVTWTRDEFVRGWFIGNFEPNSFKTQLFEVGVLYHQKGERWAYHYHKEITETNILLEGSMIINEKHITQGMQFIFHPNEISCPIFLDDCRVLCIKVPSIVDDKHII
jgi:dTDP-glucose pyrophosphorylase